MMDAIDKIRHTLIRWLSAGDMVMLNFEIRSDGKYQPHNLGPSLIDNISVRYSQCDVLLSFGPYSHCSAFGIAYSACARIGKMSIIRAYQPDLPSIGSPHSGDTYVRLDDVTIYERKSRG